MLPTNQGSIRLFKLFGVQVYPHWYWFLIAVFQISARRDTYTTLGWVVAEYVALFVIVLMHEYGHSLACRSVGGSADQIVLWPLGGVAFVRPPPRPEAELWSIAAGPLVNVALFPILRHLDSWPAYLDAVIHPTQDLVQFLDALFWINTGLLVFNLLPIYPLDGGQILRSLLWFPFGRARSLFIASIVGFCGIALIAVVAIYQLSFWLGILAAFLLQQCLSGYRYSRALSSFEKMPRHASFACPKCGDHPPTAGYSCSRCETAFDPFSSEGRCPKCGNAVAQIPCLNCGDVHPVQEWIRSTNDPGVR